MSRMHHRGDYRQGHPASSGLILHHRNRVIQSTVDVPSTLLDSIGSWWDLDAESGVRVDEVGVFDLSDSNTVLFDTGLIGNAASFVQAQAEQLYYYDPAGTPFNLADSWTFSCWINGRGAASISGDAFISMYAGWPNSVQLALYAGSANTAYCLVGDGATFKFVQSTLGGAEPDFDDVDWFHCCAWFDIADKIIHMVLNDGSEKVSATALPGVPNRSAAPLRFGAQPAYLQGLMDLVGYWPRVLTAAERTELYNGGAGIAYPF